MNRYRTPDADTMPVIGYAPGAYDLFHIGHLNLLRRAAEYCDHLVVGVVTDDVVRAAKSREPVVRFEDRLEIVRNIGCVGEAVRDAYVDKFDSWREFGYDVLFKGDDWLGTPRADLLEQRLAKVGAKIMYFPYTAHTSSTSLRRSIPKHATSGGGA